MSEKKSKKAGIGEKAGDFAKNIWLAGLGAYGEDYDEVKNPPKSVKDLPKLFRDLVEKGESIESKQKPKRSERIKSDPSENFEQRVRRMKENLNLGWPYPGADKDSSHLEDKIDSLGEEVAELRSLLVDLKKEISKIAKQGTGTASKASKTKKPAKPKARAKSRKKSS